MEFETVLYEMKEDHIVKITMNRPEKRNALNYDLLRDLDLAFEEADNDPEIRVVIFAGAGKAFCAGYDLSGSPYTSVVTSLAASRMALYAGDNQTAVVQTAVPEPPAVLVTDD